MNIDGIIIQEQVLAEFEEQLKILMKNRGIELWGDFISRVYQMINKKDISWVDFRMWLRLNVKVTETEEFCDWIIDWLDYINAEPTPELKTIWDMSRLLNRNPETGETQGKLIFSQYLYQCEKLGNNSPLAAINAAMMMSVTKFSEISSLINKLDISEEAKDTILRKHMYVYLKAPESKDLKDDEIEMLDMIVTKLINDPILNNYESDDTKLNIIYTLIYEKYKDYCGIKLFPFCAKINLFYTKRSIKKKEKEKKEKENKVIIEKEPPSLRRQTIKNYLEFRGGGKNYRPKISNLDPACLAKLENEIEKELREKALIGDTDTPK